MHRIGYHFPTEVVAQVCSHYGIRLDSSGRIIGEQDTEKLFMKISQKGQVVLNENIRDQVTINTEAKEIIRDLFPKIPNNDLFSIIKTAFQLGDNKVGTAEEIPLVRRAQLSVVAHIRHSYTNYDKLLRQLPYNEARHAVETPTLKKLVEWRGDENDQTEASRKAVDEAVREVVVLSDEESSDSEPEEGQILENKDLKVEPVQRPPRPPEPQIEHRPVSPGELSSGEEASRGYRFLPQTSRRTVIARQQPEVLHRQQQSRYALWDQVRHDYRTGVYDQEVPRVVTRMPLEDVHQLQSEPVSRNVVYEPTTSVRYVIEEPRPVSEIFQNPYHKREVIDSRMQVQVLRQRLEPAPVFRGADGRLYERVTSRIEDPALQRIYTPPSSRSMPYQAASRRSASPRAYRPNLHQHTPSLNDNNTIIQSIEQPDSIYRSPVSRYPTDNAQVKMRNVNNGAFHQNRLIDLTSSADRANQRLQIESSPPPSPYQRRVAHQANPNLMEVDQYPSQPRTLIDLGPQLPTPASSQRMENVGQSRGNGFDPRHAYATQPQSELGSTIPVRRQIPEERHIVYEPLAERGNVRHVSEYELQRSQQVSRQREYQMIGEAQPGQPAQSFSRQVIVLDSPRAERHARPTERVQPVCRTMYLQQ